MQEGGLFGYRFLFPPMRVGRHEVYWHRPLVAYLTPDRQGLLVGRQGVVILAQRPIEQPQIVEGGPFSPPVASTSARRSDVK